MGKLFSILIFVSIVFILFKGCEVKREIKVEAKSDYELVWSDEFNYEGLPDSNKWSYDVGDACELPCGCGWGNNELQYYTEKELKNARVAGGKLIIEVHKEKKGKRDFTSARLQTKGKGDWRYGRFKIRAKLPSALGSWAAIWMLPTDNFYGGWPGSGEIDIIENVGYDPDTIVTATHVKDYNGMLGNQINSKLYVPDSEEVFHDYILEWDEDKYQVFVDDKHFFTFKNEGKGSTSWPYDQPFHLILNIAFGGNWGGAKGIDPDALPIKMEVDYVHVYSKK